MFPERYRPSVLHQYSDPRFNGHNVVCDRVIVSSDGDNMNKQTFIRNWEPIGSGSFLGTVLAADFFRASAYVYENYYPPQDHGDKLLLTIVRRPTIRLILNHDKFIQKINSKLLDYVS